LAFFYFLYLMKLLPTLSLSGLLSFVGLFLAPVAYAAQEAAHAEGGHGAFAITFLWIAVILIVAKVAGLVEKFGLPSVLGELIVGIAIGNLALFGITFLNPIKTDPIIAFLAELGVVILLFQIGLESNIHEMKKVGLRAGLVAILGVVVPFISGAYIVGPLLFPALSQNAFLFLGAALTATSVGITARVFKDLGKLQSNEAKIVLGAAVIDDVLGLILLAVVSALVTTGAISAGIISIIVGKAILFLVGSIILGQILAPRISKIFAKIHSGSGMKFTIVICFGLIFAYLSQLIGLAPIVGAFAAGLVLDPVHFRFFKDPEIIDEVKNALSDLKVKAEDKIMARLKYHSAKHVEELIEPIGMFLVPIFFVYTGISVDLKTFLNPHVIVAGLIVTLVAFIGKMVSGLVAGNVNKLIVGVGMIPRGEVGLIFATIGRQLGVVNDEIFSVIIIMVILTTLLTPPALAILLKKQPTA
jgi:Kef-type K+ transport system membrane component KefB